MYTIAQAAQVLGVAAVTLRLWERQGKITSSRTVGGQRRYSSEDLTRIRNLINQPRVQAPTTPPAPRPKFRLTFPQKRVLLTTLAALIISATGFVVAKSGFFTSPLTPLLNSGEGNARGEVLRKLRSFFQPPSSASISLPDAAKGAVLASQTAIDDLLFKVNVPAEFTKDIKAPNVLYGLKAGTGINITAGQTPTVSTTDQTADLKIFNNIKVGSNTVSAGSKTDTLELAAGNNITLSTSDKKVTITATTTTTDVTTSGWTDDGTILRLTTAGDLVSIGAASGAAKLNINTDESRDLITASQAGDLKFRLTSAGIIDTGTWQATPIANAYLANSALTVTAGTGLSGGGAVSLGSSITLSNSGVLSLTGTTDQVNVSASTGAITLSLPQSIATTSSPTFAGLTLTAPLSYANGGTGQSTWTTGDVLYASATNTLAKLGIGSDGQVLTVSSGVPIWAGGSGGSGAVGWIQRNLGVLSPSNITDDLAIGGTATSSAKFQVFANTGAASMSGILSLGSSLGTQNMTTLTIGNATTGNVVLAPGGTTALTAIGNDVTIVDGLTAGGDIAVNGGDITSSATSFNLLQSNVNTLYLGGDATTISLGAATGTTTVNNANTVISGDLAVNGGDITTSQTTFNFVTGATTLNIGATTGTTTVNNDLNIGNAITDAITFTGRVAADSDLIPIQASGINDLGSSSLPWDNLYVTNVFPNGTSGTIGWWQRNDGVLSPLNITDDLIIGATATASAKFQVFADTGNATSAGNLTFDSAGTIQTTKNQTLTIGGTSTGNINLPGLTASKVVFTDANKNLTSTGTVAAIQGGTGFASYAVGDLLYADATTTLAQRTVGSTGQVLIVSGGVPTWGTIAGGSGCTDCIITDPTSTQTIIPTGVATTGLRIAQVSGGTADVFSVTNFGSTSKYFAIQSDGTATAAGSLTLFTTPTIATTAMKSLTLGDTNTGNIQIGSTNTLVTPAFKLTTGPGSGYALISDVNGVGTWTDVTTTGNLGPWTLSGSSLFPDSAAYSLLIGSASVADDIGKFTVSGTKTGKALAVFNDTGTDQNLLTASASGVTKFTVDHNGLISTASVDSTSIVNASVANGDLANSSVTINSSGILTGGGVVSLGGTLTLTATEADTLASVTGRGATTTTLVNLNGGIVSSGAVTGLALIRLDQTGDQDILAASASGVTKFRIANDGSIYTANNASVSGVLNIGTSLGTQAMTTLNIGNTNTGNIVIDSGSGVINLVDAVTANSDITATGDIAINGGDLTSTATTFNLLNATVTTLNLGGAATTVSLGAGTGTTTINNALTSTGTLTTNGTLTVNSDTITFGNAITDAMTFTARVAQDADLIPITATGTNDLGSAALPWDNLYASNIIAGSSGTSGYWQRANGALAPTNITDDLLVGGIATSSAKFLISGTTGNASSAGNLTFNTAATIATTAKQSLTLGDANTGNINIGTTTTPTITFTSGASTGNAFAFTANSLSTGLGLYLSSTSTALSSGSLASLDWSPGSATTATGDLLKLNIGANGLLGNIFNVLDNGSSVFSVSQTAITAGLPANFTAAGDVSLAYDLLFTNQTASYIKSNGPLYLDTGEIWESNDLTFQTYNAGNIVANTQAFAINGSATISGNLLVTDSQTASSSAFIANTNTAAGIVGLNIKLSSTTLDTTSRFINFLDKSGIVIGKINAANTTTVAYSANGTDMAEYFVKNDETFSPGDVVSASNSGLTKTSLPYDSKMIGIVSTAPSFVGGEDGTNKVLVAIVGQVPVKIAASSPAISKGDFVTSSIITGRATKAITPGFVIGKALEDWNPTTGEDQILIYVNNTWADPNNSFVSDIASISAQLTDLRSQILDASDPGASLSAELWQYATESGKLTSIFNVQVPELNVTGKLTVGLLSFDDLESSISSLTGTITIKGDLAVSGSIKVLGTSAGKAIIPVGSTSLTISNDLASSLSAIFVTPEDPVAISGQSTQSGQFTIRIPQALPADLKFQWWIVN